LHNVADIEFLKRLLKGYLSMKNKRLKMARMEVDMTQEGLAQVVGVTRQTIGLIESGAYNPTLNVCVLICNALGKTLDELFWDNSEMELMSRLPRRWYAIEVNAGDEDAVKRRIDTAVMARNYQHMITEVEIPERINTEAFGNCVMVKMVMTNKSWSIIRGIEGVKQHGQVLEKGKYYRSS